MLFKEGEEVVEVLFEGLVELSLVDWHREVRGTQRTMRRGKRDLCVSDKKAMFSVEIHVETDSFLCAVLHRGRSSLLKQVARQQKAFKCRLC